MLDDLVVLPLDHLTLAVVEEEGRDHYVQLDPHLLSRLLLRVTGEGTEGWGSIPEVHSLKL